MSQMFVLGRFEEMAIPEKLRPLNRERLEEVLIWAPDNQEKRGKIRRVQPKIWLPDDDMDPD